MNKLILLFLLCASISSCIEINTTGYSQLSQEEKEHVKQCVTSIDDLNGDGNIYRVVISQVNDFLRNHDKVLVYNYLPFCSAEDCINPQDAYTACQQNNAEFLVITSVYDNFLPLPETYTFPMLAIDSAPYDTDNYQTLNRRFFVELTGNKNNYWQNFHYFVKGRYVNCWNDIKDVQW